MSSRDLDRRLLAALASHGSDLGKPAHTIHFLSFKARGAADGAADELRAEGYENVCVQEMPATSVWQRLFGPRTFSCIAEKHSIPSEAAVFATSDRMNALAAKHGGRYGGWEASIEE